MSDRTIDRLRDDMARQEGTIQELLDQRTQLRAEVGRQHAMLVELAGPRGSTCVRNEEMTDAEWMRRQWRNALDMWSFWRDAYAADIGEPDAPGSWIGWRKVALDARSKLGLP